MNSAWVPPLRAKQNFHSSAVVVVDGLIHGVGAGLAAAVAVGRCPDVAEQSGELRLVVAADPFAHGARSAFVATLRRYRAAARPAAGRGSPAVLMRKPSGNAGATDQRYDRTWHVGTIRLQARLPSVVDLQGSPSSLAGVMNR
jgi:hypothetical protein